MKTILFLLSALALSATSLCNGAELVLRETATHQGPIVRLGDVADISAGTSSEVRHLATTTLFPAPAAGTDFFLTVEKLRDLLIARGIDTNQLSIKGSLIVQIGEATTTSSQASTNHPSIAKPAELTETEIELAVKSAVEQRLHVVSTTTGRWRVEAPLTKHQIKQMNTITPNITARELQPLRSGRVRFQISDGQQDWEIPASLTQFQSVVVAKQTIERGQLVRAVDVEVREREGNLPSGSLSDLQQVIGLVAQRSFRPDDVMQKSNLRAPWQVRRGQTVNVFVRTGNIVVRSRAIAKQNGAMGELIIAETLADEQRLDVTVSGPNEVTVYATGGRATDYASLERKETQRR